MRSLAFSSPCGGDLKPLPPHLCLRFLLSATPLFPCSLGCLAPTFGAAVTVGGCILRREALITT